MEERGRAKVVLVDVDDSEKQRKKEKERKKREKEEAKHDKKEEEKQIRLVVLRSTWYCQQRNFVNLLSHPSATQLRHHPVLERVLHVDELVHHDQHHRP